MARYFANFGICYEAIVNLHFFVGAAQLVYLCDLAKRGDLLCSALVLFIVMGLHMSTQRSCDISCAILGSLVLQNEDLTTFGIGMVFALHTPLLGKPSGRLTSFSEDCSACGKSDHASNASPSCLFYNRARLPDPDAQLGDNVPHRFQTEIRADTHIQRMRIPIHCVFLIFERNNN